MFKRLSLIALFMLAMMTPLMLTHAQDEVDPVQQAMIDLVAGSEMFADWLPNYPNWVGYASGPDENNVWYVEFYNESGDEWLGYANLDADTSEIADGFAPKPLPSDVYQTQYEKVNKLIMADSEVQTRLGDPDLWEMYLDYNRWEAVWDAYFYRGIEALLVKASIDEAYFSINSISDPNEFSEEQALDNARNQAINLAYGAPGLDVALDGHDDWRTYAESQGGSRWSVTFSANDQELFFALVDVQSNLVLASQPGGG